MRTIKLSVKEWILFQRLARLKFWFTFKVCKDCIEVEADDSRLTELGY